MPRSCWSASSSPTPPAASSAPTRAGCAAASTSPRRCIDHGRLLAEGSSDELKAQVGGERLDISLEDRRQADAAAAALAPIASERPTIVLDGGLRVPVSRHQGAIAAAVRLLDEAGVGIDDVSLRRPTLDDVFMALTGHAAGEVDGEPGEGGAGEAREAR